MQVPGAIDPPAAQCVPPLTQHPRHLPSQAHICGSQGPGIIDAVAHHGHSAALALQSPDQCSFPTGLDACMHLICRDADGGRHLLSGRLRVACKFHRELKS